MDTNLTRPEKNIARIRENEKNIYITKKRMKNTTIHEKRQCSGKVKEQDENGYRTKFVKKINKYVSK